MGRTILATTVCLLVVQHADARGKSRGHAHDAEGTVVDPLGCTKCKSSVMRLLVPMHRGCAMHNATIISSSTASRTPSAYCDALLPKKRQCIVYSFGVDSVWDFDRALHDRKDPDTGASAGCQVVSFDPFCCGAAHQIEAGHSFVPVGLATYDGLMEAGPERNNATFPVMTLRTLMSSLAHPKLDVLRLKVSTVQEWKGLKNLINTGTIQEIRQLSLNIHFKDEDMWNEYK